MTRDQVAQDGNGDWFVCICVDVVDPEDNDPDVVCDWVMIPDSSADPNRAGRLQVHEVRWNFDVFGTSSISRTSGISDSTVWSVDDDSWSRVVNKPPGYLAVRAMLNKWNGSAWTVCRDTGYIYNSVTTYGLGIGPRYNRFGECGAGYYGNNSGTFVYHDGAWRGGTVWSGYTYEFNPTFLAASGSSKAAAGTPPPPGPPGGKIAPPSQRPKKPTTAPPARLHVFQP